MALFLLFSLLPLGYCTLSGAETRRTGPDSAEEQFLRLLRQFPSGKYILPDTFFASDEVNALSKLIDTDLEAVLAAAEIETGLLTVYNIEPFEIWKSTPRIQLMPRDGSPPAPTPEATPEAYEDYVASALRGEVKRIQIDQRRSMLSMLLRRKIESAPEILDILLHHKSIRVQDFAVERTLPQPPQKKVIELLLAKLPDEYKWFDGGVMWDEWLQCELPVKIVNFLATWRVAKALPHVQRLAHHPYSGIRRDNVHSIARYGVQISVPQLISLLDDEIVLVRAEALRKLVLLTGTSLDQNWEDWQKDNLTLAARAQGINKWQKWWDKNGKGMPDEKFHRQVVERTLALMNEDLSIGTSSTSMVSSSLYQILDEHLVLSTSYRNKTGQALFSKLEIFWKENGPSLYFDEFQQKLMLRTENKQNER